MLSHLSPASPGHARASALLPDGPHPPEALTCRLSHATADGWAAAVHHLSSHAVHLTLAFFLPVGKEVTVEIHGPPAPIAAGAPPASSTPWNSPTARSESGGRSSSR